MKVIIVDDNRIVQRVLNARLVSLGYTVVGYANDGEEGVAMFETLRPDITILDIEMPDHDGYACLERILEIDPRSQVIMCSAHTSAAIVDKCLKNGAIGYIEKHRLSDAQYFRDILHSILDVPKAG